MRSCELQAAGIGAAPRRAGPAWRQFLHAQATGILAAGFLHVGTVLLKSLCVLVLPRGDTVSGIRTLRSPGS